MKYIIVFIILLLNFHFIGFTQNVKVKKYVLVIHGGAGTILKKNMTAEKESAYKAALKAAILAGFEKIKNNKSSIDAVETAINILEDSPLFNAGKGAVFTHEGKNELDAAIMDGETLKAGSVASVTTIKNPITAARAVMDKTQHVMLIGRGAEEFAKKVGIEIVDPKYFFTQERWDALQKELTTQEADPDAYLDKDKILFKNVDSKFGTVGAVALDNKGNLAAGTSTGGMTNKRFGRVGDAPIIGAGTYANNESVAISCTGWGEFFIRSNAAHDVASLVAYKNLSVKEAAKKVLDKIAHLGGDGGMIVLDKKGNMTMSYNTHGMYRAAITQEGEIEIGIYE